MALTVLPSLASWTPDPLQQSTQTGTRLGEVDPSTVEPELDQALAQGEVVPKRVQSGPTCGLYALGMVMDYYESKDANAEDPLVQPSDLRRAGSHTLAPNTNAYLLGTAKADGFTTQGEMFHADQLGKLAEQFGYHAQVDAPLTLDTLKACLAKGHPALVAFDVDDNGDPGLFNGKRAHWCVVEAAFQKDGVDYVVATHGWEGKTYVWRADDLLRSSRQLNVPDFPGAPANIHDTLADRLVEVWR